MKETKRLQRRGSVSCALLVAVVGFSSALSAEESGFVPLFDGKSLAGWRGEEGLWSVRDGAIVGESPSGGLDHNSFLISEREYENFILRLKFRLRNGNSGVQFRSRQVGSPERFEVSGYQADIADGLYGKLYDEKRRNRILADNDQSWVLRFVRKGGWNNYEIRALGKHIELVINGLVTARYDEEDDAIPRRGVIALQLHSGPQMRVEFKDIEIREIKPKKVLYLTTSAGFRHSSLPLSRKVLARLGRDSGWFEVEATEDTSGITPEGLRKIDAVAFYTTGDLNRFPLSKENREALIEWVKAGGTFIGFHSATDTYKDWAPYYEMIGGTFDGHPWHEEVTIDIEDPSHPSVHHLAGPTWKIKDEIYQFRNWSRDKVHVILSLNPVSLKGKGKRKDGDYAVAWCKKHGRGSVFYTSLGHREDVWTNPDYQMHILGGILWALGIEGYVGDATPFPVKPPSEWTPLFDGKTLSGWIPLHDGKWEMLEGGILRGSGGQGHIFSPREYANFHYKADVRINDGGNSGMYFRAQMDERDRWPKGMEAQVNSSHTDPVRTGSLYGYVKIYEQLIPPNEWGTQEIIAWGPYIVIKVNGRVTVKGKFPFDYRKHFPRGRFAFQQHHVGSVVEYKNVMVRELPVTPME